VSGHVPIRTCLGCGGRAPKVELLRVVAQQGHLTLDPGQRHGGRGGYLHRDPSCWSTFARRKGNVRSLKVAVDRSARAAFVAEIAGQARNE